MAPFILCLCLQSTFSMEGDKLVQVQKWDGKETKFVREIKDGKMVMVRCDPPPTGTSEENIFVCRCGSIYQFMESFVLT